MLPRYICSGLFHSKPTKHSGPDGDYSRLRIFWLQDEFALSINPVVIPAFQNIDWEAFAEDIDEF